MASYLHQYQTNLNVGDSDIEPAANGTDMYPHLNPPPRYHDYVAAQQRVANWVEQARSYQAADSMTTSSWNSEMTTRSRTRRRSSSRNGGSMQNPDQNDAEGHGADTGDLLAGSYPSPPPSRRPVSSSRSRTRASSSGTQRRRRRTRDEAPEVPPLPTGAIPEWSRPGGNSAEAQSKLTTPTRAQHSDPIPALALLSSSVVICAFLPSILTVSVFVLFLTLASFRQKEKEVRVQE